MRDITLRYLSRADVLASGGDDIARAVNDVVAALRLMRQGNAMMLPETVLPVDDGVRGTLYGLPARLSGSYDAAGLKWTAHRHDTGDRLPGILSLTVLNDATTLLPRAILESALLTSVRTAAVSALALRHLMAANPGKVALLGAGAQACCHLRMLLALFPGLESIVVWNRTPAAAERMIDTVGQASPVPIHLQAQLPRALDDADAVIACTASTRPFIDETAVRKGRVLLQVGCHEVTFEAIDACDEVVVDLWGEFRLTSAKSLFRMHRAGRFGSDRVAADLGRVVLDGWRPLPGASVYFSSFGLNIFDIALASRIADTAESLGLGTLLPLYGNPETPP